MEQALALLKEQERICRDLDLSKDLARSLLGQVQILKEMGKTAESKAPAKEVMELGRRFGDRNFLNEIKEIIQ